MAAQDLLLDANGDLDLTNGGAFTDGQPAIAQEIKLRLQTFLGEYFLDSERGLPWITWSTTKTDAPTLRQIEALCRAEVVASRGVTGVDPAGVRATFNSATRAVTVTIDGVQTDVGLLDTVEVTV